MHTQVLDGLGAVGEGAHATHEHILASHLEPRSTLLAALVKEILA
jgi:glutamate carboxypeptidase